MARATKTVNVPSSPVEAQDHLETNQLITTGWVADRYDVRPTKDGHKRIFINMQAKSKAGFYGAEKQMSISNNGTPRCDLFLEHYEAGHRLFRFVAFEQTWHAKSGRRCSTWIVTDVMPLGTPKVQEPEAEQLPIPDTDESEQDEQ